MNLMYSRILVVKKEIDDSSIEVNFVRGIDNKNIIAKEVGFTYDEMYSNEMKIILEILNKYTISWVYPDEDSVIEDPNFIIQLKNDLNDFLKSEQDSRFVKLILPLLDFAIENKKKVFIAF